MIYTVTMNPAVDKTVVIPRFEAGKVCRVESIRLDAGGKGVNVAKMVRALGAPAGAGGILGGEGGNRILRCLAEEGIEDCFARTQVDTRVNLKVIDPVLGTNTDINEPGGPYLPECYRDALEKIRSRVKPGDIVALSGSLPKGAPGNFYPRASEILTGAGAKVLLDTGGKGLEACLDTRPALIKPNLEELRQLCGPVEDTPMAILLAVRPALIRGVECVIVSRGEKGAIFSWSWGAWEAIPPQVEVKSTVGAGDSMVGAYAYALETGLGPEDTARLCAACGTAAVMMSGSQAPSRALVEEIMAATKVHPLPMPR